MWRPLREIMQATFHRLINGDARDLSFLEDMSVHLVVTSPPYWNLKRYNENPDQMGHIQDYETFLRELEKVWRDVYRVLVPGGRLVCVVGDVCVARRNFGRHLVFPLHADICVICRRIGFDNLIRLSGTKSPMHLMRYPTGQNFWASLMNLTLSLKTIWNSS
jgi:DNA modification methylase